MRFFSALTLLLAAMLLATAPAAASPPVAPNPVWFVSGQTLRLYDAAGRTVGSLLETVLPAGRHTVPFEGRDGGGNALAPGVYFLRLETPGGNAVQKLVIAR
jgi:hypothetical protein